MTKFSLFLTYGISLEGEIETLPEESFSFWGGSLRLMRQNRTLLKLKLPQFESKLLHSYFVHADLNQIITYEIEHGKKTAPPYCESTICMNGTHLSLPSGPGVQGDPIDI